MNTEPLALLEVIHQWHRDPAKMTRLARVRKSPLVKLPPQITWTLLGLFHYRLRKRRAFKILKQQLPRAVAEQGRQNTVSIEDIFDSYSRGVLPGKPEWEYELDGNLSYVRNRVTGEQVHVDVLNGPDVIFAHHLPQFLGSCRRPSPVVSRLLELFPNGRGITQAIQYLRDQRMFHVIDEYDGTMEFELCGIVNNYLAAVHEFLLAWRPQENRPILGAIIGDWDKVKDGGVDPLAHNKTESKAKMSRERWLSLLRFAAGGELREDLLFALAAAKDTQLPTYLSQALDNPDLVATALDIIGDDPAWRPEVEAAFDRTHGRKFAPEKVAAANYLARIGAAIDPLIDCLLSPPNNIQGAILLALNYAPQRLVDLLRQGLQSRQPADRLTAAAILAHLDTAASRQMLLDVLDSSTDQDATIECRAALRESTDPAATASADAWEAPHPDGNSRALATAHRLYRFDGGCERALRNRVAQLAERIDRWRHLDQFGFDVATLVD